MSPLANLPYWTYNGLSKPNALRAASICSGVVLRPTARRAGSPAGSLTKMMNVSSDTTKSTRTMKSARRIRYLPTYPPPRIRARREGAACRDPLRIVPCFLVASKPPRSALVRHGQLIERSQSGELVERVVDYVVRGDVHAVIEEIRRVRH